MLISASEIISSKSVAFLPFSRQFSANRRIFNANFRARPRAPLPPLPTISSSTHRFRVYQPLPFLPTASTHCQRLRPYRKIGPRGTCSKAFHNLLIHIGRPGSTDHQGIPKRVSPHATLVPQRTDYQSILAYPPPSFSIHTVLTTRSKNPTLSSSHTTTPLPSTRVKIWHESTLFLPYKEHTLKISTI